LRMWFVLASSEVVQNSTFYENQYSSTVHGWQGRWKIKVLEIKLVRRSR